MTGNNRSLSITLIVIAEVAAMSLWFSATAAIPALRQSGVIDADTASLFTSAVQLGFVFGTLISAGLTLADRLEPRYLFAGASLAAAAANAAILWVGPNADAAIGLRFLTGMCMAAVYPVGMKMAASWAKGDMGLMVGMLVGALTLGSASPHLFNALGGADWRWTLSIASLSAVAAAIIILFSRAGPGMAPAPPFDPMHALNGLKGRAVRLANFGYLGHMWELYAMWAWIGVFFDASFRISMKSPNVGEWAAAAAFAVIGAGAVGCVVGGYLADRIGRTALTSIAMAISGACAIFVGFLFGGPPWALVALSIVWGITIVADSAQFSASVAELSPPGLIGTMLTLQTSMGFLLTLATIHLIPVAVDLVGWRYAFMTLAIGPALGVVAMLRLRALPEAEKLAGGRR
ncbi:MAG: MFS transporter [Rhodospirillales bacterium]|nr:MFS transporter [Rhodospirillales bacterium]